MTKRELIKALEELDCPDDVEVTGADGETFSKVAYYPKLNEIVVL